MDVSDPQIFRGTDRFLLRNQLGAGAFGTVYKVYDRERNTAVALKVLRQTNPDALYRFKREFRALADVRHTNLVTLYELMTDGTHWFFTMELVDGVNFLQYVRGRSRPKTEATVDHDASTVAASNPEWLGSNDSGNTVLENRDEVKVNTAQGSVASPVCVDANLLRPTLLQLAEGVCALHQAGQIHRDIKPSNVLVTPEGRVVLLDFGLVTELVPEELRQSLTFVGTPAYMSPEQASELPVTAASDWYCVGVMLFEALTGKLPFTGALLEVLNKKQKEEPPAPSEISSDVPADLDSLCRDLLCRRPEARPTGVEVISRLRSGRTSVQEFIARPAARKGSSALIGRESHLMALQKTFKEAQNGRAVTVYLEGSSGMGKSALGQHFLEQTRLNEPEAVILTGRCYEQESVPYKALDSLIDNISRYLKHLPLTAAEALMPRDILALARLFPVLRQVNAVSAARRRVLDIPDSQELRRRASSALRELLARVSDQRPTIIFLDDLHWGDVDSAVLLAELQRPPDPPPLLLIAAYRPEEAETSPLLQTLFKTGVTYSKYVETQTITVGELSFSEAQELALSFLDEPNVTAVSRAEVIARESGGNPFFLNELVRFSQAQKLSAHDEVTGQPPASEIALKQNTLQEVILSRVIRLPPSVRRLLEIVAVAGRPLEFGVAKQATEADVEEYSALALLRAEHLILTRRMGKHDEIVPYHDRIRETIIANLSEETLKSHHYRLALALETSGRADPEMLTVHFQKAGESERAAAYAIVAAEKASEALAFERASQLYARALELRPDEPRNRDLRAKLGDALANVGRSAEAADVYLKAAEGVPSGMSLELKRRAAEQLLRSGHVDKGLIVVKAVLDSVGMKLPKTPRRALASILFRRAVTRLRGLNFQERDVAQITNEDLTRIDICWSMAIGLARIDYIRAGYFQAIHLALALRAGEPYRVVRALAAEAGFSAIAGLPGQKRTAKYLRVLEDYSKRVVHPHAVGLAAFAPAFAAFYQGRFKEALSISRHAETIFRESCTGVTWEINTTLNYSLSALVYLGEMVELSRRVPLYLREATERGDLYAVTDVAAGRANIMWLAADDVDGARKAIKEALAQWSLEGFHYQHWLKIFSGGQADIYDDNGIVAWERINKSWRALVDALTLRIQLIRIETLHLRARSALAAIGSKSVDRKVLLGVAERDASTIEDEKMPWALPLASLIRAGANVTRGNKELGLKLLVQAENGFKDVDMALYAAAARRRRGELLMGDEGRALISDADSWLSNQKVKNPTRMIAMLAPGFGPA